MPKKSYSNSLFEKSREEVIELLKDTRFCLNCRKAISYEIPVNIKFPGTYSKRRFCWMCCQNYWEQILAFKKKYRL